ncbi:hypothetical protein HDIA_3659 [Hartmannibacter diazotrophicus]|uniref:Regulator of CtrA degradation n=1 Tax=Hartmannibacter diazotrophicus TaxID=1482074 RepID=A0A2C9DAL0_9HYPH|nr:DUF1465 family protein [Hartmannibacter diazotrophicus]SON57200.1 hypothetical protein HDIA_3659 [Hartmannibacter diazotrophicus]
MTDRTKDVDWREPEAIPFAQRFAGSQTFRDLFREGMSLVEETAAYLDGIGREQSRELGRSASLVYATESMRLTTRLMQMASWLLLQRAVNEGEISQAQAGEEKAKVRLDSGIMAERHADWSELPVELRDLIARSFRLLERVRYLDDAIYSPVAQPGSNPVSRQLEQLSNAFGSAFDKH